MARRSWIAVGCVALVLGVFWTGRESTHGVGAFWEHWWCPLPLVLIAVGVIAILGMWLRGRPSIGLSGVS